MNYNAVNINLNQNYYLTNHFTKGRIMQLGFKSYELDYLCREGYFYADMILLTLKFKDEHLFCEFVRTHLLKNCWFN